MIRRILVCVACACTPWSDALAGDLNPPAGPIAPTMMPLDIVEPRTPISQATTPGNAQYTFIIDAPGSYYLTGDTQCPPSKNGIQINADEVTIDLSGFTLRGDTSAGSVSAIASFGERRGCAIRHGVITGFAYGSTQAKFSKSTFEDLHVYDNAAGGLEWNGLEDCIFRGLIIETVAELGLNAGSHAVVENCVVTGGFTGILAGFGSYVSRCTVRSGGTGIELPSGTVTGCVIDECGVGIQAWAGAVDRCTITGATIAGIEFQNGVSIRSNTIAGCAIGARNNPISFGRSVLDSNTFSGCTAGIVLTQPGTTVTRNTFIQTAGPPITASAGNNAAPVVASPAGAGPWDNIAF